MKFSVTDVKHTTLNEMESPTKLLLSDSITLPKSPTFSLITQSPQNPQD